MGWQHGAEGERMARQRSMVVFDPIRISEVYSVQFLVCSVECVMSSVQLAVCSIQCVQCAVYNMAVI